MDMKCTIYKVNGTCVVLYNTIRHGNIYRGFQNKSGRGRPTIVKSEEVNTIDGVTKATAYCGSETEVRIR